MGCDQVMSEWSPQKREAIQQKSESVQLMGEEFETVSHCHPLKEWTQPTTLVKLGQAKKMVQQMNWTQQRMGELHRMGG